MRNLRMKTDSKTEVRRGALLLFGGSLLALGCVIPPPQAPNAAPGSAASIHGAAAAPAGSATSATPIALKDCGANAMIDDGEDGNNQNLPLDKIGRAHV